MEDLAVDVHAAEKRVLDPLGDGAADLDVVVRPHGREAGGAGQQFGHQVLDAAVVGVAGGGGP